MTDRIVFEKLSAHEKPAYEIGNIITTSKGELLEYVKFESNVAADSLVVVSGTGVAQAATTTNGVGKLGVCPYAVTASASDPRYGFVVRVGSVTVNASAATAGSPVFTTATAGSVGTTATGNRAIRGAVFTSGVSGGKASVLLSAPASADVTS